MLASRYQGAVAAQAAEHPRRQVAATLSTPQAYTNNHTLEFNMAAVAAVFFLWWVRGKILDRAGEIERDMAENPDKWPFKEIVRCNIGNPQALGQAPPAFARAVLSQVVLPKSKGSKQVRERADAVGDAGVLAATLAAAAFCGEFGRDNEPAVLATANLLRAHGTRIRICEKNTGRRRYAFNAFQREFLPAPFRPPPSTIEDLASSLIHRDMS